MRELSINELELVSGGDFKSDAIQGGAAGAAAGKVGGKVAGSAIGGVVGGAVKDKYSEFEAKRDAYAEEYKSKSTEELKRISDKEIGAKAAGANKVLRSRGIDY